MSWRLGILEADLSLVMYRALLAPRRKGKRPLVMGAGLNAMDTVQGCLSGRGVVIHNFWSATKNTHL